MDTTLLEPVSGFEEGSLYKTGRIPVLDLHGTYRQMGRQYGALLGEELKTLYEKAIVQHFHQEAGFPLEDLLKIGQGLFEFYPLRFKHVISGMAETSGLEMDQHIILNALELYGIVAGCSGIAAWGDYTAGGPLVFGRNYDWYEDYREFARSLTVTVLHPDASVPTAFVTFAGVIYATTGMNREGLFLELNNGKPSGGDLTYLNRTPAVALLLAHLLDCSTLKELDAAFHATRTNFSFIINAADGNTAYAYEWPPFALRRRGGDRPGLLVATNHFTHPAWGLGVEDTLDCETVTRRDNLLALGEKNKGLFNAETMMELMDVPMDRGGATWPATARYRTLYQIVAVPEERRLWLKVPGYQDWTSLSLKPLFA